MKHLEKMDIVNSANMGDWSANKPIVYTGHKDINYELGSKVIDLLAEYGLGVVSVTPGDWLKRYQILLPDEQNIKEYRVQIGKKQGWDDFLSDYEIENDIEDYNKLSQKKKEKINSIYDELPYEFGVNDEIEFSVFLPNNVNDVNKAAMSDASTYLKLLSESGLNDIMRGVAEYHVLFDEPDGFKNFINNKRISITNKNLEYVIDISTRLYKDSKVFNAFEDNIGDRETKDLINNWLNLIK